MADLIQYTIWALKFGSAAVPLEMGKLGFTPNAQEEKLQGAGSLKDSLIQVRGSRPTIRATLLDPSLVTGPLKILASGGDYSGVSGYFRAYADEGAFGAGYYSFDVAKGLILPKSLSASQRSAARLNVEVLAAYVAGVAITVGTAGGPSLPSITKAYYPTSVVIGADTIVELIDVNVQWDIAVKDLQETFPSAYFYDRASQSGTATIRDLSKVTAGRLVTGTKEAVTLLLTDQNDTGNTLTVSLGTCRVTADLQESGLGQLAFTQVAA